MDGYSLITGLVAAILSLFTFKGSCIYTVCYEDVDAGVCYVYDEDASFYKVEDEKIVPLTQVSMEAAPALTYLPVDAPIRLESILPGLYESSFRSSCALLTRLIDDGYCCEVKFRDPSRFEAVLSKDSESIRAIVTADNQIRLYSQKSDIFSLIYPYINGDK